MVINGGRVRRATKECLGDVLSFSAMGRTKDDDTDYTQPRSSEDGGGLLLRAIQRNDSAQVERRLDAMPSLLEYSNIDQRTPLHIAAAEGQLSILRDLLERGALPNSIDRWGGTARDDAQYTRDKDCIALLEQFGGLSGKRRRAPLHGARIGPHHLVPLPGFVAHAGLLVSMWRVRWSRRQSRACSGRSCS